MIASPLELWRTLLVGAGLEIRRKGGLPGRDADIEDTLKAALGAPSIALPLEDWLRADAASANPTVTTEQLMVEVLKSQGGFAQMMKDILDVLVSADAREGSHHLRVQFKFDDVSDPIKATLEEFREQVERIQRVLETHPELPDSKLMWEISEILRHFAPLPTTSPPPTIPSVPHIKSSGDDVLDAHLALVSRLTSDVTRLWRRHGEDRPKVIEVARSLDNAVRPEEIKLRSQLRAASDFWDIFVIAGARALVQQVTLGRVHAAAVSNELEAALRELNWGEVWIDRSVKQMLDILNLPAWKRRHELYSVWVGTRMLDLIGRIATNFRYLPVDGLLSFEFGGSRLATYTWQGAQYDVWSELRSALVGTSTKRKKGIQPDFRVMRAHISNSPNSQTNFVLECKHYLSPSISNFSNAAQDYARSCPGAVVHVINHGPVDEVALLGTIPSTLSGRTRFIGDATAPNEKATQVVAREIHSALFAGSPFPSSAVAAHPSSPGGSPNPSPVARPGSVGYAVLEWDGSLRDMDLSLRVLGPAGGTTQCIDYKAKGSLESAPFARLADDAMLGPGQERIDVSAWHFDRYEVVVTNYTGTGWMTPNALSCTISIGSGEPIRFLGPHGPGSPRSEWRVAVLERTNGVLVVKEL